MPPETSNLGWRRIAGEPRAAKRPGNPMPWWSQDRHADRRPVLIERGRVKKALRAWFEAQGFTEVECGALAVSPGNEAHLHAFETELRSTAGEGHKVYLHT